MPARSRSFPARQRLLQAKGEQGRVDVKILVIEDDADTAGYIADGLRRDGHTVDVADTGKVGLVQAIAGGQDVLVVDRRLPEVDGLTIVKTLRGAKVTTPVLFLTTMAGVDDRVEGLEAGADDYLVKPFAFSELLARVHALGRRPPLAEETTVLTVGDLQLDLVRHRATRGGVDIDLMPREFRLLECLMRHAGRVVTRTMLLEQVWDFHFDPKTSVVETHVSRLRAKIDRPFDRPMIQTRRGAGYVLAKPG